MVAHDEQMRRAVEGLRAKRSPSAEVEARLFATLEQRLGEPPGGSDGGGSEVGGPSGAEAGIASGGEASSIGWWAKVAGATVGMTAGGLLALRIGVVAVRAVSGADEVEGEREEEVVVARAEAPTQEVEPVGPDGPTKPSPSEAASSSATTEAEPQGTTLPAVEPAEGALAKSKPAPEQVPPASSTDQLAAELALLQAAKLAKTPIQRLESLDRHAKDFPAGALASEREALAVVALCELDRVDDARARALALVEARPGSPLIDRMRSGCPALADELGE